MTDGIRGIIGGERMGENGMLGKRIDRAALTALGATGYYAAFMGAGAGIPLSGALAFGAMALTRRLILKRPGRSPVSRARAEAAVQAIARMPGDAAFSALRTLAGREDACCALRYPEAALTAGEVYRLWRQQRRPAHMTLVATCPADAGAREAARSLGVELIDRRALTRRVQQTGFYLPPEPAPVSLSARLRGLWLKIVDRPAKPRAVLTALGLIALYRLTGGPLCLLTALALLLVTGVRWIRGRG